MANQLNASAYEPSAQSGININPASPQYGLLLNQTPINKNVDVAGNPIVGNNNPPVTPVPLSQPSVITGNEAKNNTTTTQATLESQLASIQQQAETAKAERMAQLDEQAKQQEARLREEYGAKEKTLTAQQGEESATNKALNFKLGREGTFYAEDTVNKLNAAHQGQINDLTGQMNDLISRSRQAIQSEQFSVARQLQQEADSKFNKIMQLNTAKREQEAADLKATSDKQASAQKNAELYAPNIYEQVMANPEGDYKKTINDWADKLGVDPAIVSSELLKYKDAQTKSNLDNAAKTRDILEKIGFQGTVNLPGIGSVTIKKQPQSSIGKEWQDYLDNGGTLGFNDYATMDANRKAVRSTSVYNIGGLSGPVQTRVQSLAGQFDNEQVVRNYNTIAESVHAAKTAGSSPTDDIQRVYAFAKVMDPNSAVREGEYKTVQDYSQALLQAYGLKAKRVFDNTGFLTPQARTFLQSTLNKRLESSKQNYDNIYNEYGRRINKITGGTDGKEYITDYGKAFDDTESGKLPETKTVGGKVYVKVEGGWQLQQP